MRRSNSTVKYFLSIIICLSCQDAFSQIMHAGLKGGFQLASALSDDSQFRKEAKIRPVAGYNAGAVFSFKVKDRFFLHTEYLYSVKGKKIVGRTDPRLEDNVRYNYIEVPILYNMYFKGQLKMKSIKQFKWYAGIGPNLSYWLGGRGNVYNDQLKEDDIPVIKYKIKFGKRPENESRSEIVYYNDVKRFQLGLNIGGGILLEPINNRKIMVDLRFSIDHTWLGKPESADYLYPLNYDDNLKARNVGAKLSLMYLFETSLDKKSLNKGKSTIKKSSTKKKRR
jgi:hypothetical protein